MSVDTFRSKGSLEVGGTSYEVFRLSAVPGLERLPFSLKVLAENLLRTEDGANVTAEHVRAFAGWDPAAEPSTEIQFTPARVVMQDFTGVPCVVDLATMREAVAELGGDPARINPLAPAELVIDHSVQIDVAGRRDAFERNVALEYERNHERYQFLRWGQTAFDDFKVVPPGTGIVHQVNIEYLARTIMRVTGMPRLIIPVPPYMLRWLTAIYTRILPRALITQQWLDILATNRAAQLGNTFNTFGIRPRRFEDTLLTYMPGRRYWWPMVRYTLRRRPKGI